MNSIADSPCPVKFNLLPGRTYRLSDILARQHPAPDPIDNTPLPPLPPPRFVFDPDALTIRVRYDGEDFTVKLAGLTNKDAPMAYEGAKPTARWFKAHGLELRDEVEDAAWRVFSGGRRFVRTLVFGGEPEDFDLWEALKAGATLDWRLGAVIWPSDRQASGRVLSLFELDGEDVGEPDLIQDRYLCRGGSWLITGPTGVGKSSLVAQLAIAWGIGKPCLGFAPAGPIATLIVQAENDAGDLCEQRDGITEGLQLSDMEQAQLAHNVGIVTLDDATGKDFFRRLESLLRDWKPDLLVLDPLLAFVGGDVNKQEVASDFLRRHLNPILHRLQIASIVVHHVGKPPRDGKDAGHQDYSGLGSSELSNWARAIADLRVEGDAFSLTLGKRGKRAGITDSYGATRLWLRHAQNLIFWETCEAASVASKSRAKTPEDMLAQVPVSPGRILKNTLLEKAKATGFGEKRSRAFLDELLHAGTLHLHREKRPGTNPLQFVARHPQSNQPELAA